MKSGAEKQSTGMNQKGDYSIFKSLQAAFVILLMHVLLIGGIGALIIFFYGIVNHMVWILVGISIMTLGGYWVYRRLKSDGKVLKDIAGGSLQGKTVEVSFLGGVANFKITDSPGSSKIALDTKDQTRQLTAPGADTVSTLTELGRLYENNLISLEEFNKAKQKFFK